MNEGKSNKPVRMSRDDPPKLVVGLVVIAVEGGNHDRLIDTGHASTAQIML
jgi:hypothetical protein